MKQGPDPDHPNILWPDSLCNSGEARGEKAWWSHSEEHLLPISLGK